VVMEVKTGEIRVLANLGRMSDDKYGETYNYAVGSQGLTDPGSTIKLASLMALLEETSIELSDSVNSGNGLVKYYDAEMRDSKEGGHGRITVQQAFELSSNVAFLKLITTHFGSKPQRFIDYLRSFGLDSPLGFQMAGTAIPYLKNTTDRTWNPISLPWTAVGYESKMSPLQMLVFYNAVANNGKMVSPVIVKEIRSADKVLEKYKTTVLREQICSPKTLAKLKKCLIGVVERGTAKNIRTENYKIAGKTGTSQKFKKGRYTEDYYTSFAGFFPAENPKYSCIVVIDDPQGVKQYGGDVAAPVFREIADKIFAQDVEMHKPVSKSRVDDEIFPLVRAGNAEDLQYLCQELKVKQRPRQGDEWVSAQANGNTLNWKPRSPTLHQMPDVSGMTLRDALFVLENKELRVKWRGKGRVVGQSPEAGSRIIPNGEIRLELE
jgi:cell division protein FtsI (penicillin-binding protein 3)